MKHILTHAFLSGGYGGTDCLRIVLEDASTQVVYGFLRLSIESSCRTDNSLPVPDDTKVNKDVPVVLHVLPFELAKVEHGPGGVPD